MKVADPGIYPDFDVEAYHADPCPEPSLSSSVAKLLVHRSPAHAAHAHPRLNPDLPAEEYDARKARGQAAHKLLLGRGAEVAVVEGFADWRKKEAQAARDEALAAGLIPMLEEPFGSVHALVESARATLAEYAPPIRVGEEGAGQAEVLLAARDPSGVWLRALVDWLEIDEENKRAVIYDYKSTEASAAPGGIARLISSMRYDFQGAFYERVLTTLRPELAGRIEFRLIVQEVDGPQELSVVELSEADLDVARHQVSAGIARWAECLRNGHFPGYDRAVQRVTLPPWHSQPWLEREMAASEDQSGVSDWILAGR